MQRDDAIHRLAYVTDAGLRPDDNDDRDGSSNAADHPQADDDDHAAGDHHRPVRIRMPFSRNHPIGRRCPVDSWALRPQHQRVVPAGHTNLQWGEPFGSVLLQNNPIQFQPPIYSVSMSLSHQIDYQQAYRQINHKL